MMNGTKDISDFSDAPSRPRLKFDLDADICVVGGGLAGLTMARDAALKGASVVLLEAQRIGWNASGNNLGTVMPGFGVPIGELIERVGFENTRELWKLSEEGVDYVRAAACEESPHALALTDGVLEVSNVEAGEDMIGRLQMIGDDFGSDVEGWQVDKVRESLKTKRYFHGIHYPKAFQIDGRAYVHHLATLAEKAGVRIFEDTSVVSIDPAGIRKRVVTPSARLRCSHIVLAGNMHLGSPAQRLTQTLMPTWRYAALTEPLGDRLAEAIAFTGSVMDSDDVDQFRVVQGDRLLWSSFETTWRGDVKRYGNAIRHRISTVFPQLGKVAIAETFSGAYGQTVHGMPQIGEIRPGLWVLSGFGRQGLNTTAMGGALLARSILWGDSRVKLFTPFELVWAGGAPGRVAGHAFNVWSRNRSAAAGVLSRYRERSHEREVARERTRASRMEAAKARVLADRERAVAAMRKSEDGGGSAGVS